MKILIYALFAVMCFTSSSAVAKERYEVLYDYTGLATELPLQELTDLSCEISDLINEKSAQEIFVAVLDVGYYFISAYTDENTEIKQWSVTVAQVQSE